MTTQQIPFAPAVPVFQIAPQPLPQPLVTYSAAGYYRSPLFWACNCPEDYVHPAEEKMCPVCGYPRAGAPSVSLQDAVRYVSKPDTPHTPSVGLLRELVNLVADEVGIPY